MTRIAAVRDEAQAAQCRSTGATPVIDRGEPPGLELAAIVGATLGAGGPLADAWAQAQHARVMTKQPALVT